MTWKTDCTRHNTREFFSPPWTHPVSSSVSPVHSLQLLSDAEAKEWFHRFLRNHRVRQPHRIFQEGGTGSAVNEDVRNTQDLGIVRVEGTDELIDRQRRAAEEAILQTYGQSVSLVHAVDLQVLGYDTLGKFSLHADSHIRTIKGEWIHNTPQRVFSSVTWLSTYRREPRAFNEFNGGQIRFPYFTREGRELSFEPRAGQMVVFPSHPAFSHEVLPVIRGYRMALTLFWNTVK